MSNSDHLIIAENAAVVHESSCDSFPLLQIRATRTSRLCTCRRDRLRCLPVHEQALYNTEVHCGSVVAASSRLLALEDAL